jgi:glycosyltransferase involved in cell wall biosynthesis
VNSRLRGPVTLEREIVIVDDGSTDGTRDILSQWMANPSSDLRIIFHAENGGKGAALRTGFEHATGDLIVIQDADLEYDPRDYVKLLEPILEGRTPVVYGSRFSGGPRAAMSLTHTWATRRSPSSPTPLRHVAVGHGNLLQVFSPRCDRGMPLRSRRFEIEPELTAKILKRGYTIFEVPISYNGRAFHEGKKDYLA